jgi:hypothetical protein
VDAAACLAGLRREDVLTLRLQPAGERYSGSARMLAYFREASARIAALPGVGDVGLINHLPLSGYNWLTIFSADDQPLAAGVSYPRIGWRMVDGDYFAAMRIPLRAGPKGVAGRAARLRHSRALSRWRNARGGPSHRGHGP